jgi:hypothetical protein
MPLESLLIFDPRRNFQLHGFTARAATTTLYDATGRLEFLMELRKHTKLLSSVRQPL